MKKLLISKLKRRINFRRCYFSIRHLFGEKDILLNKNEAGVVCLVKNGEYYIESFIRYYKEKGFKHIFLLDNGSSDNTLHIAKKYPFVSVYQTNKSVGKYQALLKKAASCKFIGDGWCLDVDIDEFFDYPYSDRLPLNLFLDYLNSKKYNVCVSQMLDMFSDKKIQHLVGNKSEDFQKEYVFYDMSAISKVEYDNSDLAEQFASHNIVSNENIKLYFGGIRKYLYGLNCLLTKHSLFYVGSGIETFTHVHFSDNASLADLSCVLYHYKLTSNAMAIAIQNKESFQANSDGYKKFIEMIESKNNFYIKGKNSLKIKSTNDLVVNNFLSVSEDYKKYTSISR